MELSGDVTAQEIFNILPVRRLYSAPIHPQTAGRLMFLSRWIAFSLPWKACVHSHCLMSKIESKPFKLVVPCCRRHGTAKTMCVDISLVLSCSFYSRPGKSRGKRCILKPRGRPHTHTQCTHVYPPKICTVQWLWGLTTSWKICRHPWARCLAPSLLTMSCIKYNFKYFWTKMSPT